MRTKMQVHEHYALCTNCHGRADLKPSCPACLGQGLVLDGVDRNYTTEAELPEGEKK